MKYKIIFKFITAAAIAIVFPGCKLPAGSDGSAPGYTGSTFDGTAGSGSSEMPVSSFSQPLMFTRSVSSSEIPSHLSNNPEPATVALLSSGLLGYALMRGKKRRK